MNEHDEGREEKQRIEKDAIAHKIYKSAGLETRMHWKSGYIAGATAENNILREQLAKAKEDFDKLHTASNLTLNELAKEQKLRKELVEKLVAVIDEYATMDIVKIKHDYPYYEDEYKYIRTLIQEAKGT